MNCPRVCGVPGVSTWPCAHPAADDPLHQTEWASSGAQGEAAARLFSDGIQLTFATSPTMRLLKLYADLAQVTHSTPERYAAAVDALSEAQKRIGDAQDTISSGEAGMRLKLLKGALVRLPNAPSAEEVRDTEFEISWVLEALTEQIKETEDAIESALRSAEQRIGELKQADGISPSDLSEVNFYNVELPTTVQLTPPHFVPDTLQGTALPLVSHSFKQKLPVLPDGHGLTIHHAKLRPGEAKAAVDEALAVRQRVIAADNAPPRSVYGFVQWPAVQAHLEKAAIAGGGAAVGTALLAKGASLLMSGAPIAAGGAPFAAAVPVFVLTEPSMQLVRPHLGLETSEPQTLY